MGLLLALSCLPELGSRELSEVNFIRTSLYVRLEKTKTAEAKLQKVSITCIVIQDTTAATLVHWCYALFVEVVIHFFLLNNSLKSCAIWSLLCILRSLFVNSLTTVYFLSFVLV